MWHTKVPLKGVTLELSFSHELRYLKEDHVKHYATFPIEMKYYLMRIDQV